MGQQSQYECVTMAGPFLASLKVLAGALAAKAHPLHTLIMSIMSLSIANQ